MPMETNNSWMKDEELKDINPAKLEFLSLIFNQSTGIDKSNQKEMLSFLMSLGKQAKASSISFDKSEIELIFKIIRKYSTPDDIAKMEKLSSVFPVKINTGNLSD
jgi:hypothetical protein